MDCRACIEDFGQRHPMRLRRTPDVDYPSPEGPSHTGTIRYCDWHDAPHGRFTMTGSDMDPKGVMAAYLA